MSHHVGFVQLACQACQCLSEHIQASIVAGELRPGDQLPPILEMARTFRVGAATVREALILLEAKRIVEIRHGTGVFIAASAA